MSSPLTPGLRVLRQERWECLVSYLCSGTNGIRGIVSCVEKIARLSGRTVRLDGEERYLFPTPRQPNAAGRESLDDLGLGLDRARNIFLMGIQICYDQTMLDRAADPGVPGCEIVRLSDSYRGIGPKIASCVALMSLDKLDAFPVDRWVQRALSRCDLSTMPVGFAERVTGPRPLTDAQQYRVPEWARGHFGEYAGYANQYLFHWVEPHKERVGRNRTAAAGTIPVPGNRSMASPREGRINGGTRSQQQSPLIRRARSGSSQRSRQTAGMPGLGGGRRRTREFPTEATQGQDAPEGPQPPAPAFLRPRGRSPVSRALAGPSWQRRGETKATLMARSAIGPAGEYEDITRETLPQGNRSREVRRTTKGN